MTSKKSDPKTDAWMPLWIGAYLADTMRLTTVQHGAYLLLLMAYWRDRKALPDDDDELRSITKTDKSEWKKMRPTLEKFFKLEGGVWWHKRVEAEIAKADSYSKAATSRAKAGAKARWDDEAKHAPGNAQAMLEACSSNAQALLNECPTPSPLPITSKEVALSHSSRPDERGSENEFPSTEAGEVCKALKRLGMGAVSPENPELLALINKGVNIAMFEDAATKSVAKLKGFRYMLAIVKGQLSEAAAIESGPGVGQEPWDTNRKTIEAKGVELGLGKWDEFNVNREQFAAYVIRVRKAMDAQGGAA